MRLIETELDALRRDWFTPFPQGKVDGFVSLSSRALVLMLLPMFAVGLFRNIFVTPNIPVAVAVFAILASLYVIGFGKAIKTAKARVLWLSFVWSLLVLVVAVKNETAFSMAMLLLLLPVLSVTFGALKAFGIYCVTVLGCTVLAGHFVELDSSLATTVVYIAGALGVGLGISALTGLLLRYYTDAMEELENSRAELAAALSQQTRNSEKQARMFAIVGHELRTPLASLRMMLGSEGGAQARPEDMTEAVDHLLATVDDMRVAVDPSAPIRQELSVASPAQIVRHVARLTLRDVLERSGIRVGLELDEASKLKCAFNAQALRRIVVNLIKNAALHSDGNKVHVSLSCQVEDGVAAMSLLVADDGKGIPPEQRPELFEAFARGDTSAEGSGLGLHIVRVLAESLGGGVAFETSPFGGAAVRVTMRLPLAEEGEDASRPPVAADTAPLSKCRVLLAEDHDLIRQMTGSILEGLGATVCAVSDGQKAVDEFTAFNPDVVLTDIMMPNVSGFELVERLRGSGYQGCIVAVTAAVVGTETDRILSLGADHVISKPIRRGDLLNILRKAGERHEA